MKHNGKYDISQLGFDEDIDTEDCSEDGMDLRLQIAHQAQNAAASEGPNSVFACPYCDKQYLGKHARSIWRRHLQDKHSIPLSQQPRRTRWDGDVNRPKNAEERRQRMLESKRRWARKKRMQDKARKGGDEECESKYTPSDDDDVEIDTVTEDIKVSKTVAIKKRKAPHQIKFHHMTTADISSFGDYNQGTGSNAAPTLWTTVNGQATTGPQMGASAARMMDRNMSTAMSNTLSNGRSFKREASAPHVNKQAPFDMGTVPSPRRALGQIDPNVPKGRRLARSVSVQDAMAGGKKDQAYSTAAPPFVLDGYAKTTPINRFAQLYPTPPSAGDDKTIPVETHSAKGKRTPRFEGGMALLSPPASQHTQGSSPVLFSKDLSVPQKRHAKSILTPNSSRKHARSTAGAANPFSLDQHKISPTSCHKTSDTALEPPLSVSRLTGSAKKRIDKSGGIPDENLSEFIESASPVGKGAPRLPPLVNTPLRTNLKNEPHSPDNAIGLFGDSSSVRRNRSGVTTPTQSRMEKLMGGSMSIGLTPFEAKMGAQYSVTRGYMSRPSPMKRGDQFSSPQNLNLTQSLGLAPHSTVKGSSSSVNGYGSVSATPFINSFLANNSPWTRDLWPESIMKTSTFRTSSIKRSRGHASSSTKKHSDENESGDDDDDTHGVLLTETPSRPAKMSGAKMLGSPTSSAQKRQWEHDSSRSRGSPSSSHRSHPSSRRQSQLEVQPISFKLSSPAQSETRTAASANTPTASFDGELLAASRDDEAESRSSSSTE